MIRGLLIKAGYKIAENMSSLSPEDAAIILLIYSFFGVKNPGEPLVSKRAGAPFLWHYVFIFNLAVKYMKSNKFNGEGSSGPRLSLT